MTDREKLVAVLNEIEDEHGFICDSCGESKKSFCIENFADHLIANGVTVRGWISVEDRLPEDGRDVVVFTNRNGGTVEVAYYRYAREAWFQDCILLIPDVLSWMPLPEPPKEE